MTMTEDRTNLFVAVREGNLGDAQMRYLHAWDNGFRLLCEALESKQSEEAAFLLKSGAKIKNIRPLQLAVINGDIALAKILLTHALNNHFDIDAKDNHGKNIMFYAAQNADFPMFKLILDHGAKVKYSTGLLSYACKYNCIEIVQVLLNKGVSANDIFWFKSETGKEAIWYAIDNLNLKLVRLLLANNAKISANLRLIFDWMERDRQMADALSPDQINGDEMVESHSRCKLLKAAVHEELIKVVQSLLDDGANTNCECCNGMNPLSSAVFRNNEEITRILLTSGANASNKSRALSLAVVSGQLQIVRLLLEHKADVNAKVQNSRSVLHYSVNYCSLNDNSEEFVNLLLQFGADVNVKAADGSTALHSACEEHLVDIVLKLLRHGANPNIAMNNGETALYSVYRTRRDHMISEGKSSLNNNGIYLKIAEMLLENGAHVNNRDDVSKNMLHLACVEEDVEMVRMLLRYGADVNITNASDQVPISSTIELLSVSQVTISCILTEEIVKLVSMDLKVNEQNLRAINSEKLIKYKVECEQEIALLKDDVFDEVFISFYDILIGCTNSILGYMRNDVVMQVLGSEKFKSKYPKYAYRISCKLEKALEIEGLLEKASVILHDLTRNQIPGDCIQRILYFLTVGDLKNFIEGQCVFFAF